jgi:hypothetical protein
LGIGNILYIDAAGTVSTVQSAINYYEVYIDLSQERLIIAEPSKYIIMRYSLDRGGTWRFATIASMNRMLPRLLNRDMELWLSDTAEGGNLKRMPNADTVFAGRIIAFDKIYSRPNDNLVVNYSIFADNIGITPGAWTFTERNGTIPFTDSVEIRNSSHSEFVRFTGSIPIKSWAEAGNRVLREQYSFRIGARDNGLVTPQPTWSSANNHHTYTAASRAPNRRPRRITIMSEQRAPNYRIRNNTITIRANTFANINGTVTHFSNRATIDATGVTQIWQGATARRPASAKWSL